MKAVLYQSGHFHCRDGKENLVLSLCDMLGGKIFNVSKWKSQPAPAMFVREVVATSDLHQTVRPLNPTNETRPILYSYHLTVLASEIVNSVHLSTFFEAFLWRLLIDERKTFIFWEKCFVEKYD